MTSRSDRTFKECKARGRSDIHPHHAIADAHNAALAAEREKVDAAIRIYTRCPACHNDTLTINDKHLLCTWHECPDPTLIEHPERAKVKEGK